MNRDRRMLYESVLFTVLIGLLLLWTLRVAESWDELRASIIVFVLGSAGVVLAAVQVIKDLWPRRGGEEAGGIHFDAPALQSSGRWGNLEIWGWILGFYAAIRIIGFPTAVPLFVFGYAKTYGAGWLLASLLAAAAWAFIYGVFEHILHVPWPEPFLAELFFSPA